MSRNGTITIKNWKRFQHYAHRNPPWIKLHRTLLNPEDCPWYRGLSDNTARFLVELWLLASRDNGKLPFDSLMILRETNRTTADIFSLHKALRELASVSAIAIAGTDASADFITMLEHRGTEVQSPRVSVASQPADAAQEQQPNGNGGIPRETPSPYAVLFPLIRQHLWRPDGKPPAEVAGKPWDEDREGTVIRELAKSYTVSDLEVIVMGLGNMLRGLAEAERPDWLAIGAKASLRAVFHTRSGVVQMVEHCRRAYWSVENKRPKKPAAGEPTRAAAVLP